MPRDRWFTKKQIARIMTLESQRLEKAGFFLENEIKESFTEFKVSQAGGRKIIKVRKGKGGDETKHVVSRAGEPPAIGEGRLKSSITWGIIKKGKDFILRVGTNVKYARRLEFGFSGEDSLGRIYNQKPRPFLFPTFRKNRKKIQKILAGG